MEETYPCRRWGRALPLRGIADRRRVQTEVPATPTARCRMKIRWRLRLQAPRPVAVTVNAKPAIQNGQWQISADGGDPIPAPHNFYWSAGDPQHNISVTTPQTPAQGVRGTFTDWTDSQGNPLSSSTTLFTRGALGLHRIRRQLQRAVPAHRFAVAVHWRECFRCAHFAGRILQQRPAGDA